MFGRSQEPEPPAKPQDQDVNITVSQDPDFPDEYRYDSSTGWHGRGYPSSKAAMDAAVRDHAQYVTVKKSKGCGTSLACLLGAGAAVAWVLLRLGGVA